MVVIGDSLLAGFGSGGFIAKGRTGQNNAAPSLIARQAGERLTIPSMSAPGVPPPLVIVDADGDGVLDPGDVKRRATGFGFRSKPFRSVRNLAVPGEDLTSVFHEIAVDDIANQIVGGDVSGRDALKFLIVGLPPDMKDASQISRAKDLGPSFLLVWLGNNDVLGMATDTNPTKADLGRAEFAQRFRQLLNELADTGADMAVANLPDVTGIAALRRAAGEVTTCDASGTPTPVAEDDLLSIDLPRSLLPVPPCGKVLDVAEQAQVRATVVGFNEEIAAAVADVQANRGRLIALVDVFSLFDTIRTAGVDVTGDGVPDVSSGYLGGLFSLDGIHPTRTGHALIANVFIDAIDLKFGETIPRVDVARVASNDFLVGNRFRPAGEPPFGLIGDDDTDEIETFFDTS
jgi:lysophospholipase L1-like esterase